MQLIKQPPTSKAPAELFTGDAWWDVIYQGEEPSRARANMARGGRLIEAHPGDIVHTPPGEEHWHGAAPDRFMIHLALWEGDETTWLEHVSDAEYGATRSTV
ncbi:cupin domain-containing protein [Nonomuraea zeae]|uniref:Cupin domain-containing protein n=1 Tax=Nonomuraea zeae TaxID=1642303 RepID=A0A5S4GS92_9ACTN|nr:cupin domain-containing protein [Nonomuraea zeae]TMR35783.1 cupin domain-containing protein [Nonomuraea zeae]